jgi:hypothetical protein
MKSEQNDSRIDNLFNFFYWTGFLTGILLTTLFFVIIFAIIYYG